MAHLGKAVSAADVFGEENDSDSKEEAEAEKTKKKNTKPARKLNVPRIVIDKYEPIRISEESRAPSSSSSFVAIEEPVIGKSFVIKRKKTVKIV